MQSVVGIKVEGSGSGPHSGRSPDSRPSSPDSQEIPAEHYYIDTILTRHARKMLEEMRLRDLGQFAAHMGFQLVPFLKREQGRAAKMDLLLTGGKGTFSHSFLVLGV